MTVVLTLAILVATLAALPPTAGASPRAVQCAACWHPPMRVSWQWQLSAPVTRPLAVQMYDVDMFETSRSTVTRLHALGIHVLCYIDAGTWEDWRPDASRFPPSVLGRPNGWPGERWLDIRKLGVLQPIMLARVRLCRAKGFDGVEFDNVDGYANRTGFPITAADQLRYDIWLANTAHRAGLSVALKNDNGQVGRLLPYFDMALDEQCFQYHECRLLLPFIRARKPVFEVEYSLPPARFCPEANRLGFNALRKHPALGPWRIACR